MAQNKDRTGKPALMKELNIGLIMDALEKKGQATRVELAALTKLSQPTVNMLIRELRKEQAVLSLGIAESTGGRRAEVFATNSKRAALAAVLVKRDVIEAVVTDLDYQIELHEKRSLTTGASCTEELISLLHMLFDKKPQIRALCVGVPGSVSADGEVFSIPSIPEWERFDLKKELERTLPASVCIMNDMNAIAAGYLLGSRRHAQNFVYLHAEGAGVGAGIVIDGKLYSGFHSFAGEVGSMLLGRAGMNAGTKARAGSDQGTEPGTDREEDACAGGKEKALLEKNNAGGIKDRGNLMCRENSVEDHMLRDTAGTQRTDILTTAAINLICVLNPEEMLFGGDITEGMMRDIYEGCRAYLPGAVLPQCRVVSNYIEDYFNGLCRQAREMLSRHIRVV